MMRPITPYFCPPPPRRCWPACWRARCCCSCGVSLYEGGRGHGFFTPGTWTAANYSAVTDGYGLRLLLYTILFGAAVACLTVLLAYPFALFLRSLSRRWRRIVLAAVCCRSWRACW